MTDETAPAATRGKDEEIGGRAATAVGRGALRRPTAQTVGTGSAVGVGCLVLLVAVMAVLAIVFFLPYLR